ncbi:MAG: hypothetical protein LUD02_06705 [Tannerellaceae bacterium]|nr:hypothetical protein [Tannerellaceae bacterium]
MLDERTFELADEPDAPGVNDDITGDIIREVFLKQGRVVFTCSDEIKELGNIVLKTRY